MAVVHGEWCGTKTWPTSCPSCSAEVFFFSCGCGSRVFFDELGSPWPVHDCDESWARGLKRYTDGNGDSVVEISPGITVTRSFPKGRTFRVEPGIVSRARKAKRKEVHNRIEAVEPKVELRESHTGILREIMPEADPLKAFKLSDTKLGRAYLGPIGAQVMGKITVHVPYPTEGYIESFTSWIPAEELRGQRIRRGVTVALDLDRIQILGRGHAWFCEQLRVL